MIIIYKYLYLSKGKRRGWLCIILIGYFTIYLERHGWVIVFPPTPETYTPDT